MKIPGKIKNQFSRLALPPYQVSWVRRSIFYGDNMPWIESHQALKDHPKTLDLMAMTGWNLDTTIGKLHRLWWWCIDYAPDGDLQKHSDDRLAVALDCDPINIAAMFQAGWLDVKPYRRVHNWWDFFGRFLQVKYKNMPKKWKKIKNRYKGRSKGGSKGGEQNTPPNLTIPNLTKPTDTDIQTNKDNESFERYWSLWPRKEDKQNARRVWAKLSPSEEVLNKILAAVAVRADTIDWQKEKGKWIPLPTTWLNGRRWEDEVKINELNPNLYG